MWRKKRRRRRHDGVPSSEVILGRIQKSLYINTTKSIRKWTPRMLIYEKAPELCLLCSSCPTFPFDFFQPWRLMRLPSLLAFIFHIPPYLLPRTKGELSMTCGLQFAGWSGVPCSFSTYGSLQIFLTYPAPFSAERSCETCAGIAAVSCPNLVDQSFCC
jgi:hypothetical protein